jgi:steroid 5-alpha reductase family enzyme
VTYAWEDHVPQLMQLGLEGLAIVCGGAAVLWLVSLATEDASIADRFWGIGFVVLAAYYASRGWGWPPRAMLVLALTAVWGLRLSLHIHLRNRGKPEDPRYARWREAGGDRYWLTQLFKVFLLQALLMWVIAAPLLVGQTAPAPDRLTAFDLLGAALWLVGFAFEAVGDAQLAAFKKDPANEGRVLSTGLWRYTRHPNYFGDSLIWWGLFVVAAGVPGGFWTVFSPILMTWLLVRVSGVRLLEESLRESRPEYADYVARTSSFLPRRPRDREAGRA